MIRYDLKNLYSGGQLRRPQYRAKCKDGRFRLGYLCFMVKKHWFGPATEKVYLRETITGKLYRFHPETLACWTGLKDKDGRPICNGDYILREDSYTGAQRRGEILYCQDVAAFVWRSLDSTYKNTDFLWKDLDIFNDSGEHNVHYTYTIINKRIKQ